MESTSNEPRRPRVAKIPEEHQDAEPAPSTRKVTSTTEDDENMDITGDETPMTKRTQQHGKDESMTETSDRHEPGTVDAVGKPSCSTPLSLDSSTTTSNSTTFEEEFKTSEVPGSAMRILAENYALELKLESQRTRL